MVFKKRHSFIEIEDPKKKKVETIVFNDQTNWRTGVSQKSWHDLLTKEET